VPKPEDVRAGFNKFTSALAQKKASVQARVQAGLAATSESPPRRGLLSTQGTAGAGSPAAAAAAGGAGGAASAALEQEGGQQQQGQQEGSPSPEPPLQPPASPSGPLSPRGSAQREQQQPQAPPSSSAPPSAPQQAQAPQQQAPSRKGVHVTLLAEGVELIGERGTKVPNVSACACAWHHPRRAWRTWQPSAARRPARARAPSAAAPAAQPAPTPSIPAAPRPLPTLHPPNPTCFSTIPFPPARSASGRSASRSRPRWPPPLSSTQCWAGRRRRS
jgi:hypothetical protein